MSSKPAVPKPPQSFDLEELATALTGRGFYVMGYLHPKPVERSMTAKPGPADRSSLH